MHTASPLGKLRVAVIICCLILIIGIFGYTYLTDSGKDVLTKEDISANIAEIGDKDFGYTYVSSYIKKYGIGNFNSYKINEAESKLDKNYYKPLPDDKTLAKDTVELFLEYFYDSINLSDKEAVTDALLKCMISSIGDKYAFYRNLDEYKEYESSLEGGEEYVGIGVSINQETLEIGIVFNGSGAEEAGILPCDIIYAVDGTVADETNYEQLVNMMRGEPDTTVEVTVLRGEELHTFTVTRKLTLMKSVNYRMGEDKIGYIHITQFLLDTVPQFMEAVDYCTDNGAIALVIDVRDNPGGLLYSVDCVIDYLTPDAPTRRISSYTQNGVEEIYYTSDGHSVDIPIAVLCNEYTASAGELFTGAMRDYGEEGVLDTVIIGKTTYGKGIVQSSFELYDKSALTFTIGYFNPPSNVNFNGIGVIPEIEIEKTTGKDEVYEVAVEEVLKMANVNNGTPVSIGAAA